jgi:hypothetical protein
MHLQPWQTREQALCFVAVADSHRPRASAALLELSWTASNELQATVEPTRAPHAWSSAPLTRAIKADAVCLVLLNV